VALGLVALPALLACSHPTQAPSGSAPATLSGHGLTIQASIGVFSNVGGVEPAKPWTTGVSCTSYNFEGVDVQVSDGSHNVVGVDTFPTKGLWTKDNPEQTGPNYKWDGTCTWTTAMNVPDAPIYIVEVTGFEPKTVSNEELASKDWVLRVDLG
jgi:hypothetical protein